MKIKLADLPSAYKSSYKGKTMEKQNISHQDKAFLTAMLLGIAFVRHGIDTMIYPCGFYKNFTDSLMFHNGNAILMYNIGKNTFAEKLKLIDYGFSS